MATYNVTITDTATALDAWDENTLSALPSYLSPDPRMPVRTRLFMQRLAQDKTVTIAGKAGGLSPGTINSVANGGTGLGTLTAHAVLIGEGLSAVGLSNVGTAGQVFIGQSATTDPAFKTVSGSGATVTMSAAGVVTISSIPNATLQNSSVTVTAGTGLSGGGAVSLGSSVTVSLTNPVAVSLGGTGLATLTAHAVMLGEGTGNVAFATIGTGGRLLIDQGAGADPAFTAMSGDVTITSGGATTVGKIGGTSFSLPTSVPNGGTANTTFTAYAVICAGTTATGAFQNVSGVGTSGQVLTSNGANALPTWQAASGGSPGTQTVACNGVLQAGGGAVNYNASGLLLKFTTSAGNIAALLPSTGKMWLMCYNDTSNSVDLWCPVGGTMNGTLNSFASIGVSTFKSAFSINGTDWYTS